MTESLSELKIANNITQSVRIPLTVLLPSDKRSDPEALAELKTNMGVTEEEVEFRISVGQVLFDLYTQQLQKPTAPMALKRTELEIMTLAQELRKDSFLPSRKVLEATYKVFSDDEKFKSTFINAEFDSAEAPKSLGLIAQIIYSTPQVLHEILSLCESIEESK
jgi:hypothetical protein